MSGCSLNTLNTLRIRHWLRVEKSQLSYEVATFNSKNLEIRLARSFCFFAGVRYHPKLPSCFILCEIGFAELPVVGVVSFLCVQLG